MEEQGPTSSFADLARASLPRLLTVLVRVVGDPALAYDLATETMARAKFEWDGSGGDQWLLDVAAAVLDDATARRQVPAIERRRGGRAATPVRLSAGQQQEIARLAEARLDLSGGVEEAFHAFVRNAPPPPRLSQIRPSGLIEADPLSTPERDRA